MGLLLFRSKHTTKQAILHIFNGIYTDMEDGKITCGVLIDLKRHLTVLAHNIPLVTAPKLWYKSKRG